MSKIILSMDGRVLKEYPLDKERLTIGRKPENDIHIDNLAVSGRHAAVVTILNDSFLEDLGSTNGTLVNGSPVQKHFLQNNDLIEIGKYKMKYIVEKAMHAEEESDMDKTMVIRKPAKPAAPAPGVVDKSADGTLNVAPAAAAASAKPAVPVAPVAPVAAPLAKPVVEVDRANVGMPAMSTPKPLVPPVTPASAAPAQPAPPAAVQSTPPVTPAAEKPVIPTVAVKPAALAPTPAAPAMAAKPASPAAAVAAAPAAATAAAAGAVTALAAIQILSGPNAGKEMDLAKTLTTLGKPGVQVAVITRRPHGYFITHVEGADFPTVGGEKLDAQPRQLKDHDIIELAGVKMEFFVKT